MNIKAEHMEKENKNKATIIPNGPMQIEGNFMIQGINGELIAKEGKVYLCRCGKSEIKPFCDGSHKK